MAADGRPSCSCHGGQQRFCSGEFRPGTVRGANWLRRSSAVSNPARSTGLADLRCYSSAPSFPLNHARPCGRVHISPGLPRSTMKRLLLTVSAVAAMSALATAQCFETNLGTSIGLGDDLVLAVTPMNITFPMGGIAASYTHVQPTTNGLCYLTNGVAAVGATGTGYGTAPTMVTNLRGLAGQNPRIAPYWRDLNLTAANAA